MSDEPWQRLKRVFQDALEEPEDARAAFLDRECAGDADLRAEVESLLASHDEADGFLSRPAMEEAVRSSPPTLEGRRIGAYRILGEIGRGGMGVVYRAVRDDDAFHKTVALKVVRGQGGWGDVEQRLQRERQILARLQHPNIASVLDGGTTEEGQPYLVMELRRGPAHHRVLRRRTPWGRARGSRWSARSATPSSTRTATWSSIATSSRATSW